MNSDRLHRLAAVMVIVLLVWVSGCASNPERVRPRGSQGGFTVLVEQPERPSAAQVAADIGNLAVARGLSRLPARPGPPFDPVTREAIPKAPDRYGKDGLELEVSYQPATHRVSAYFRNPASLKDKKFISAFFRDYHREFAPRYGDQDPISESAFSDDIHHYGPDASDSAPVTIPERPQFSNGY